MVDVWDALNHERPYRDAWSEEDAVKYLEEMLAHSLILGWCVYFSPRSSESTEMITLILF